MPDVFDTIKRSEVMSVIKGTGNKTTELAFVAAMRQAGVTGWRRHLPLRLKLTYQYPNGEGLSPKTTLIRPDFTFRRAGLVVFVDGCFWHGCPIHSNLPQNNADFWIRKLNANCRRDRATDAALRRRGWRVMRVWEHELRATDALMMRLRRRLAHSPR